MADVAHEAGVSVTTASRALNNKGELSSATREAVLRAAERLRYVPSEVARALVSGKTGTVGAIITDNASPIFAGLLRGIEDAANARGYGVLLTNSRDVQERALRCIRMLRGKAVDGVICTPVQQERGDLVELRRWGVPLVLAMRYFPDVDVDFVVADNEAGGHLATSHLLDLGHASIGHIGGREGLSSTEGRIVGYLRALSERGVPPERQVVRRASHTIQDAFEVARALLRERPRPTAIYAATHQQAVGTMKAARELGLRIPDDLALVGGDEVELAEFLEVPLTTVEQPSFEIGLRATAILLQRMAGEGGQRQGIFLAPTLNIRQSSVGKKEAHDDGHERAP